jgi:hypothetical protein
MSNDPYRTLRLRWEDHQGVRSRSGRINLAEPDGTPSIGRSGFIGRVRDSGSMPTTTGKVFLVNPVRMDGLEAEGSRPGVWADSSRSIPVVVVGSVAPKAGELITVHASGGRWIAEFGGRPASLPCGSCNIPRGNLTLTLANGLMGTRSVPLLFNGVDEWSSGCVNQLNFRLNCRAGTEFFSASHYSVGPCPTGQAATCTSPGTSPLGLTLTNQSCDPFLLQYTTSFCPGLAGQGYTRFTITR